MGRLVARVLVNNYPRAGVTLQFVVFNSVAVLSRAVPTGPSAIVLGRQHAVAGLN